ncbi:hypothetical protein KG088_14210 [Halomonas sp. TRM85114]|uniref:hypothetical protein n=1 Tax=Halomonas jincaotanensis TaxID=2810616 RepID=UPI001BD693C0|nr:hypothetical protein [Halomonas jincaotanensis]MBS9404789.1 hypothetical protein [Halomonas jincaotanensis]
MIEEDEFDTFEELQAELDSLLLRIKLCMQHERLENMWMELDYINIDEAVKAVYCYASQPHDRCNVYKKRTLKEAASLVYFKQVEFSKEISKDISEHGLDKGHFLNAIKALNKWDEEPPYPLNDVQFFYLGIAATSYLKGESQHFGQNLGVEVISKRAGKIDRRLTDRHLAAFDVFIRNLKDPKANPIAPALFSDVGSRYGMSGSTVRDAYYNLDEGSYSKMKSHLQKMVENL